MSSLVKIAPVVLEKFLKSCQCIFSVSQLSPFWREHGMCCVGGPFLSPICRNKLHTVTLWIKYTNDIHEKKQHLYLQRNLNFFCIHTIINLYPYKDNMTRGQISQVSTIIYIFSFRSKIYSISRNLALLASLFSSLKLCIANNTSCLDIMQFIM